MIWRTRWKTFLMAACLCAGARASTIAIVPHGSGTLYGGGDRTWGWWFYANEPITVSHLGAWNPFGHLNAAHEVGIWNAGDVLLGSVVVPAGPGDSPDRFRWVRLSVPLLLAQGGTYKIGMFNKANSGDPIGWSNAASGITVDPAIELANPQVSAIDWKAPNGRLTGRSGPWGWFGPNFQIEEAAVPEPASAVLAGMALAGVAVAVWRRGPRQVRERHCGLGGAVIRGSLRRPGLR
jgi:hypothetical protein